MRALKTVKWADGRRGTQGWSGRAREGGPGVLYSESWGSPCGPLEPQAMTPRWRQAGCVLNRAETGAEGRAQPGPATGHLGDGGTANVISILGSCWKVLRRRKTGSHLCFKKILLTLWFSLGAMLPPTSPPQGMFGKVWSLGYLNGEHVTTT